ncbi:MAG TPA: SDR family NAD(P)-dependent oxidoreductase, partial [Ignavibacteriales bacterium]|nr:SDR family NAD(P)-dependent oxidoreductase [Ignavibacteriales bacterium]
MSSISGKTVLITGGASGIGKLMGERVLEEGAEQLVIWDINEANLKKTTEEFKSQNFNILPYLIDISKTESVIETAKKVKDDAGAIDILINNAGVVVG